MSPIAAERRERAASSWLGRPPAPRPARPPGPRVADRALTRDAHASLVTATAGFAPPSPLLAWFDWAMHLALAPGKQAELVQAAAQRVSQALRLFACAATPDAAPCVTPLPQDRRFVDPAWQRLPFSLIWQTFLLHQQWWHLATTRVPGMDPHHEDMTTFMARQWLDRWAPSNFVATNPVVLECTLAEQGGNLVRGLRHLFEDAARFVQHRPPVGTERFHVGRELAVTPGRVVMRNHLIELLQYAPATAEVHAEPVLIVPAWILKYYILDLTPADSLVRWLVSRGHTVFMISWRNPDAGDRNLSLDDYRTLGPMAALDEIGRRCPGERVHAAGYCLGGTLLAITAAAMARDGDERLAGVTLLTAQVDFTEPGELGLFIDESQVVFLEDLMRMRGYLDAQQMAWAFQMLRSNDLIWSYRLRNYLLGERQTVNALMAWNADTTRMPQRMHSEYLRALFLRNDLAGGRFEVDGRPISLSDVRAPVCAIATLLDHIAPWRSCFKVMSQAHAEVTFLLASGGHNSGIVTGPQNARSTYQARTRCPGERFIGPDDWLATTEVRPGTWWPSWQAWLAERSRGLVPARTLAPGEGLADAPGQYVLQR